MAVRSIRWQRFRNMVEDVFGHGCDFLETECAIAGFVTVADVQDIRLCTFVDEALDTMPRGACISIYRTPPRVTIVVGESSRDVEDMEHHTGILRKAAA